jgi:hypothetical protein
VQKFRINRGVSPYGGKIIEAETVTDRGVTGFVVLSSGAFATAKRTYLIHEVTPVPPEPDILKVLGFDAVLPAVRERYPTAFIDCGTGLTRRFFLLAPGGEKRWIAKCWPHEKAKSITADATVFKVEFYADGGKQVGSVERMRRFA